MGANVLCVSAELCGEPRRHELLQRANPTRAWRGSGAVPAEVRQGAPERGRPLSERAPEHVTLVNHSGLLSVMFLSSSWTQGLFLVSMVAVPQFGGLSVWEGIPDAICGSVVL